MDLKGTFLVIVLVVSVIAEEEPNRHRMDINRLLVDVRMIDKEIDKYCRLNWSIATGKKA